DQMHRVSIDSFQPETQRYALKRGVGYLNDIQGFPDPALYPDIAEADCRLVVMHSAQRDGIATRTGHLRPEDALDEIVRFFEARVSALRRSGVAADRLILDPGMGFFLSPAPETSLHVLSNLQKLKSALGLPLLVSVSRKSFLGATVGLPVKDLGPASLAAELHAIGNGADYVRTHAPGDLRSAITFRPPASGPWSGSAKVGADMLGSSGSNCTMRRRFIPRQGSEWTARSLRTFGSPARVISTRLCG
ncbi:dihydropteroate synthase, partial [Escherichia coli]|nr:dihydropteroate synthase [Escherichia coli]